MTDVVPIGHSTVFHFAFIFLPKSYLAMQANVCFPNQKGEGYVSFLERLRDTQVMLTNGIVTAPSFSHSLKDPVMDDVVIRPHHRIVIIEGLYVFLNIQPWIKAGRSLDERWFVRVDPVQGKERLCHRHVETGVAGSWEEAVWRAESNDIPSKYVGGTHTLPCP